MAVNGLTGQVTDDPSGIFNLAAHFISAGAISAYIAGFVPYLFATPAVIYYCLLVWENRTVQHFVRNRRMVHKARKIAKLRSKQKVIIAELEAIELIREARVIAKEKVLHATHEAEVFKAQEVTDLAQGVLQGKSEGAR